jgi:anti-sigma regulatory factor (Ser/Thr protein kinase)
MVPFRATAMSSTPRAAVSVAATPAGIAVAADTLSQFWVEAGFDPEAAWAVQVALDEILANIVRHGTRPGPASLIEITFVAVDGGLQVTVVDDGPEFDPLQLPEPDLTSPLEARQPGGLGVHLVRQLMDSVDYERRDGRNWLVITRRVRAPGRPGREEEQAHGHPPGTS